MSLFDGFGGGQFALPMAVWLAAVVYNLPISLYVWRRQPLMNGRGKWLLWADLAQATLTVFLTGGYRSFYFVLFLLTLTELALAYPWRFALTAMFGIGGVEIVAMTYAEFPAEEPFAVYLVVGKFTLTLLVGGLAIILGELMRREESARQDAARSAKQAAALNNILIQLGESGLNLESTLTATLNGARLLCNAVFSLILLPDSPQGVWRVAACNSARDCVGERVSGLTPEQLSLSSFALTAPKSLLPFIEAKVVKQAIGIPLRTREGVALGILVAGWGEPQVPDNDAMALLRFLAHAASIALRNAHLYAQEQEHVARLKRFEQVQSTFFSAIGHELKTPLTVLKMLASSLPQWTELSADTQSEIADTFTKNLERLETLIADWLESARLEAGAVRLHFQSVNLVRISQAVIDALSPLAARKQQKITLQAEPSLHPVHGDRLRLEQVLSNLLGNAIKFSPPHSKIGVRLQQMEASLQVCVEDTGPGVPLSEQERIFDKFYTATENQALAGAGLGLFVCEEFVRLHGGRIWVEDRLEGGSRFCFTIPYRAGEEFPNAQSE